MINYTIVGAGIYGLTVARLLAEAGISVTVMEKKPHIGGLCYTRNAGHGVHIHEFGGHIFHTDNHNVWNFVSRFCEFNGHRHTKLVLGNDNQLYPFPVNMFAISQVLGISDIPTAQKIIHDNGLGDNFEERAIDMMGRDLYRNFFKYYTTKHWGMHPTSLPASILKRVPVRFSWNNDVFLDKYQGVPTHGYTDMFQKMADHPLINVHCNENIELRDVGPRTVYTGCLDTLFDDTLGGLEYRCVQFSHIVDSSDDPGISTINDARFGSRYTRRLYHKYFSEQPDAPINPVSYESAVWRYGADCEPSYPIPTEKNTQLSDKYKKLADDSGILYGGRLADYAYYDMDVAVGQAMVMAEKIIRKENL